MARATNTGALKKKRKREKALPPLLQTLLSTEQEVSYPGSPTLA
jgi:hypothetical protein